MDSYGDQCKPAFLISLHMSAGLLEMFLDGKAEPAYHKSADVERKLFNSVIGQFGSSAAERTARKSEHRAHLCPIREDGRDTKHESNVLNMC